MICALDNQMRMEWQRTGHSNDLHVSIHPQTFNERVRHFCESHLRSGRCRTMRWGNLYFHDDATLDEGMMLLLFRRPPTRADRPEDV